MSWRDKIKAGFLYQIGESGKGKFCAVTGKDGAVRYGEELEKMGILDAGIQDSIYVLSTDGIRTDTRYYKLNEISWVPKVDPNELTAFSISQAHAVPREDIECIEEAQYWFYDQFKSHKGVNAQHRTYTHFIL